MGEEGADAAMRQLWQQQKQLRFRDPRTRMMSSSPLTRLKTDVSALSDSVSDSTWPGRRDTQGSKEQGSTRQGLGTRAATVARISPAGEGSSNSRADSWQPRGEGMEAAGLPPPPPHLRVRLLHLSRSSRARVSHSLVRGR